MALYASWAHGNAVVAENPENMAHVGHFGWGSDMAVNPGRAAWFHVPVPTPVMVGDVRVKLQRFFLLFNVAIAYHLFGLSTVSSWLVGCFVALGYMIHLLLDEIYSVDITGARIKKSFGTALKFASFEELKISLALGAVTVALFFTATPALSDFVHALGSQGAYASLHERFLPKDRWFSISFPRHVDSAGTDDTLSTGSIRPGK